MASPAVYRARRAWRLLSRSGSPTPPRNTVKDPPAEGSRTEHGAWISGRRVSHTRQRCARCRRIRKERSGAFRWRKVRPAQGRDWGPVFCFRLDERDSSRLSPEVDPLPQDEDDAALRAAPRVTLCDLNGARSLLTADEVIRPTSHMDCWVDELGSGVRFGPCRAFIRLGGRG